MAASTTADVCAIEHAGNMFVFRRPNDLPTVGMFIDKSWDIARSLGESALKHAEYPIDHNVSAVAAEAAANLRVNERHLGVTYAEART